MHSFIRYTPVWAVIAMLGAWCIATPPAFSQSRPTQERPARDACGKNDSGQKLPPVHRCRGEKRLQVIYLVARVRLERKSGCCRALSEILRPALDHGGILVTEPEPEAEV